MASSPCTAPGGSDIGTPYVDELVRRLQLGFPDVVVDVRPNGAATVRLRVPGIDHPVSLHVHERDLGAAVVELGRDGRKALRPGSSLEAAGFDLLLVHLDEVLDTRDTVEPLRITRRGLLWPEQPRED